MHKAEGLKGETKGVYEAMASVACTRVCCWRWWRCWWWDQYRLLPQYTSPSATLSPTVPGRGIGVERGVSGEGRAWGARVRDTRSIATLGVAWRPLCCWSLIAPTRKAASCTNTGPRAHWQMTHCFTITSHGSISKLPAEREQRKSLLGPVISGVRRAAQHRRGGHGAPVLLALATKPYRHHGHGGEESQASGGHNGGGLTQPNRRCAAVGGQAGSEARPAGYLGNPAIDRPPPSPKPPNK